MTWTKTGSEFPNECAHVDLSDAAYRTHHEALTYLASVEDMSCRVPKRQLRFIARSENWEKAVQELLDVGFWRDRDTTYEVVHAGDLTRQSLAAQAKKRDRDKKAQRRHRAKSVSADVSADVSAGVSGDADCLTGSPSQEQEELGKAAFDDAAWLNGRTRS